ncbi:sodium/mannose cotransporter SLC5A10-like [Haliotis asinina]|uniref:sodium/mannose cotransporter SLC5A10-like n=1 Tax=Haliotis asinina TaxID=109174 RepID=UPI0035321EB8
MSTPGLQHWGDITIVVVYFVLVLALGLWTICRPNRGTVQNYYLAGRNITWFPVGASVFSSNIGSEHFLGLAGQGAAAGIAMVTYEFSGIADLIGLSWLFLPVYVSAGVYTLPEYIGRRFGGRRMRTYLSVLSLVLYVVTKLAVSIYAGGLFIKLALGWNMYISITGLLVVTGVYTILGGLTAVIYTDTFQTVVMTAGAISLTVLGFQKIGGYDKLEDLYMNAIPSVRANNTTCGLPREDAFHIFRDPVTSDQPWPGLLVHSSLGVMWYWCCDQVIVQRTLAAKSLSHAKAGVLFAGYLKFLPLFIMIFPGMISRALFPDVIACADAAECEKQCENPAGCSSIAYPKLVLELLPIGLRGLMMAVMLSAIMSSLTSIFNSASTLFTMDLWRRMRPRARQRELLIVGRVAIVILCGVSILWIPMIRSSQGGQLFNYIQAVQGYLGTPIGPLFIMAVLWKRMNEAGAFWGLLISQFCGVVRMVLDFVYPMPPCGQPDTRPLIVSSVHYTYFSIFIFVFTGVCIVVFSYTDTAPTEEQLRGVTWWTRVDQKVELSVDVVEEDKNDNSDRQTFEVGSAETDDETGRSRCIHWTDVCGIPKDHGTADEVKDIEDDRKRRFLQDSSKWRMILNFNAGLGLVVMAFMYGYFK